MTGEHFLIKLAQIGLQFAVFTAVLPLLTRSGRALAEHQIVGIKLILDHQFALLFSAIAPYLVFHWMSNAPQVWVWRLASLPLAIFLICEMAVQGLRIRKLGSGTDVPAHSSRTVLLLLFLPAPFVCGAEFWNVARGSFPVYLTGVIWLLVPAAIQFWGLVVHLTRITD